MKYLFYLIIFITAFSCGGGKEEKNIDLKIKDIPCTKNTELQRCINENIDFFDKDRSVKYIYIFSSNNKLYILGSAIQTSFVFDYLGCFAIDSYIISILKNSDKIADFFDIQCLQNNQNYSEAVSYQDYSLIGSVYSISENGSKFNLEFQGVVDENSGFEKVEIINKVEIPKPSDNNESKE